LTAQVIRPDFGDWRDRLDYKQSRRGDKEILHTKSNATTLLRNDPGWRDVLAWDDLSQAIVCRKPPPWYTDPRCIDDRDGAYDPARPWEDEDGCRVQNWLQRKWSLNVSDGVAYKAALLVAKSRRFDPVRDWLGSLKWDDVPRVDTWLSRYLGVEDTPYARFVGRAFLIGSVARGLKPGVKMDTMLILEGPQGLFKSQAVKRLYGADWFRESPIDLRSNDRFLSVRGCWCREWPELDGLGKADANRVKSFLSAEIDDYRQPYGRTMVHIARRCVMVATVNPPQLGYLTDESGNRRVWPVECGRAGVIDLDAITADRPQIWAEAVALYREGVKWWPATFEERRLCNQEQEGRMVAEVWQGKIAAWLDDLEAKARTPIEVTVRQVLGECLLVPPERWDRSNSARAGACLARLGWIVVRRDGSRSGDRERYYGRENPDEEREAISGETMPTPA
jgi:predicted P-loop ATPase